MFITWLHNYENKFGAKLFRAYIYTMKAQKEKKLTKVDLAYLIHEKDNTMPYLMLMMLTKKELEEKYNKIVLNK